MSIILGEFPGVLPSQLASEPIIPLLKIIEVRRYIEAVQLIERHAANKDAKAEDAPSGPMIDKVCEIQSERIRLET